MVQLPELYQQAAGARIHVLHYPLRKTRSLSLRLPTGVCFIAMDESTCDGSTREREHLTHELGHCMTNTFYTQAASQALRQYHEHLADEWAIHRLIPAPALEEALSAGITLLPELAEHFGVSVPFVKKAICLHYFDTVDVEAVFPDCSQR